jgi:hypothetical protein
MPAVISILFFAMLACSNFPTEKPINLKRALGSLLMVVLGSVDGAILAYETN